jgi:hypothetical protein
MIKLRSHKVLELPAVPETNSIYYVVAPTSVDYLEIYVTGSTAGVVRRLPNINDISTVINELFADFTPIVFVPDIPNRDLLNPDYTVMAIVADASGDITVSSGQAVYVFNILTSTWVKISHRHRHQRISMMRLIYVTPIRTCLYWKRPILHWLNTHMNKQFLMILGS